MRALILLLPLALAACETPIMTAEPPAGTLRPGQRALVDDGRCPPGQLREVTGTQGVSTGGRQSRCVPRP